MRLLPRELSLNERRLVELVFRHEHMARIDLAAAADITPASVTRLVAGLMELSLFSETTLKEGARGQPKKLLKIRRQQFCSLGFYLFTDRIQAALIDFGGTVIAEDTRSLGRGSAENVASGDPRNQAYLFGGGSQHPGKLWFLWEIRRSTRGVSGP